MIRSGFPEPVGCRFGIVAKALLAVTKCVLGELAVLDVGRRAVPFDNVARLIAQRHGFEQKPAIFTIEAPEPRFKAASQAGLPYRAPLYKHILLVVWMKRSRPD